MTIKKITRKGKQSNKIKKINISRATQKECLLILEKKILKSYS